MLALPFVALALGRDRWRSPRRAGAIGAGVGPRGEGSRARAGAGRRLAARLAGDARRRHRPARAPSLGGQRGRAGRTPAPAAVGAGAAAGRAVAAGRDRRKASTCARRRRRRPSALRLRLGGGPLPAGRYGMHFRLEAASGRGAVRRSRARPPSRPPGAPATFDAEVTHPGGPLTLSATTAGSAGGFGLDRRSERSKPCIDGALSDIKSGEQMEVPPAGRGHVNVSAGCCG